MKRLLHAEVGNERADAMSGEHKLKPDDLNHLVAQLEFRDSLCAAYDAGSPADAK